MKNYLFIFTFFSIFIFGQKDWKIKFYTEKTKNGYIIFADNMELTPISTVFNFELNNMRSSLKNGQNFVIPAETKKYPVVRLTIINPAQSHRFEYKNSYNYGDVRQSSFDDAYTYSLPFEQGKKVLVNQGYNGNFSHQNQNALDFQMPEGSKIYAAREGKVVEVVEHNSQHCSTKDCAKFNNKIMIMHSDGTFADYLHIQPNGAAVNPGDFVEKGQLIGYSGNTGWSNGPHLHFSVFLNRMNGERYYIRTIFRTAASEPELLKEGQSYYRSN